MISRPQHVRKKRDSILDAAIEAFRELGYENASMDYIAELAQASKRTVYNHFPAKDQLFKEVLSRFFEQIIELKKIEYSAERSLEEQLGEFVDAEIAVTRDASWLGVMKVSLGVVITHPDIAQDTVDQCAGMDNSMIRWLQAAKQDGRLQVDDVELASSIFDAMILGAFTWPAAIHGPMDERKAATLKQALIETFLARYQA